MRTSPIQERNRATVGLPGVREVPWGEHVCHFYRTRQDLTEVAVPFFATGLRNGERCIWITAEPLEAKAARQALALEIPDLELRERHGQIDILDYEAWYTQSSGGVRTPEEVLNAWLEEEARALARGLPGLRISGNTFFLDHANWQTFQDYEAQVHRALRNRRIVALCSYSLEKIGPDDVVDVLRSHGMALFCRNGAWEVIRSATAMLSALGDDGVSSASAEHPPPRRPHGVRFFPRGQFPAGLIADLFARAFAAGDRGLIVARELHGAQLRQALRGQGLDVEALLAGGRLKMVAAEALLGRLVEPAGTLTESLERLLAEQLGPPSPGDAGLIIYGEAVDVLCERGQGEAAVALEEAWNQVLTTRPATLLCGYTLEHVGSDSPELFRCVTEAHDLVFPVRRAPERSGAALRSEAARRRGPAQRDRGAPPPRKPTPPPRSSSHRGAAARAASDHLVLLQRVTSALSEAVTPDDVGEVVVNDVAAAIGASLATLAVPSEDDAHLLLLGRSGPRAGASRGARRLPITPDSPWPVVAAYGRDAPIDLASAAEIAERFPGAVNFLAGIESLLCVPLELRDQPLGVLGFGFSAERRLGTGDRALLDDLVRQVILALDRARLYDDAKRARDRSEYLADASARFSAARLELPALLASVVGEVTRQVDACAAFLRPHQQEEARFVALRHLDPAREAVLLAAMRPVELNPVVQEALESARPVVARGDLEELLGAGSPSGADDHLLVLPLLGAGQALGALVAVRHGAGFSRADQELLEDLSERAALWIENAQHFERARAASEALRARARQQAALADLGRRALILDTRRLMDEAALITAEMLGADLSEILEIAGPERLRLCAGSSWSPGLVGHLERSAGADDPAGFTLLVNQVVISERLATDPRFGAPEVLMAHGVISGMTVPIPGSDRPWGVLGVHTLETRRFSEEDAQFLCAVANVLGAALEREGAERQAEHVLLEANQRKDEFLAVLGHELRNPLAPIVTALELMKLRYDGLASRERAVIERQVLHVSRLVDDLLDVSRITRGKLELAREPVELAEVVALALEMASPVIERRTHRLTLEMPPEGLVVRADRARMAQVVANLLTNAAKYTDPGGHITLGAAREGGEILLWVRDTGVGLGPEVLAAIFEPFMQVQRTLERAHGGLGLGLALVKSLVELHDGSVSAFSEGTGRGSEFTLRLPAEASLAGTERAAPAAKAAPRVVGAHGRRVLLVDDNPDAADALAELLRVSGHEVRIAYDGPQALSAARGFAFDLGILDIGLPVMDGYELARRLREQAEGRALRLVALTGYGTEGDRDRSKSEGFESHFVKPVDPSDLLDCIEGGTPSSV